MNKIIYEYCVIRYVADIEREEFINVGLIMMCKRYRWIKAEIVLDEDRLTHCFRKADLLLLKNQLRVFELNDVPQPDLPVEERYRWLAAVKSAIIQTSPSHPGLVHTTTDATPDEIKQALNAQFFILLHRLVK